MTSRPKLNFLVGTLRALVGLVLLGVIMLVSVGNTILSLTGMPTRPKSDNP